MHQTNMQQIFYHMGITIFHTALVAVALLIVYKAVRWAIVLYSPGLVYQCERAALKLARRAREARTEEQLVGVYKDTEKFYQEWTDKLGTEAHIAKRFYYEVMNVINKRDGSFS